MTEENTKNNQISHQCKECGLHYKNKDSAQKCEAWCKEHKTCNVQITNQAEENKKNEKPSSAKASESELEELKKKCEEYLNNWKRERADFLNYKKDEVERMINLAKYEREDMILEILPILDNIYLAERQLPEKLRKEAREQSSDGSTSSPQVEWTKGFLQIQKQLEDFLKKEGIEEIKSIGNKFDPNTMEVIALSPEAFLSDEALAKSEAKGEGSDPSYAKASEDTVVEELQKGYMLDGKVLRPAKVKVTK